jgi:hypothetical protein
VLLVAGILVAWEGYVRLAGVSPVVLPGPVRILEALWTFRGDAVQRRSDDHRDGPGYGRRWSTAIAAAAATDQARVSGARRAAPVTSQTIPVVALAPLFLLWFGFGLAPKVLVVGCTFFPIVVALLDGFGARPRARPGGSYGPRTARRSQAALAAARRVLHRAAISVVYAVIGAVFGVRRGARGLQDLMQLSQNVPDRPRSRRSS